MIPYSTQYIDKEDINSVIRSLKSKFITQGPLIERFEKKICKLVKVKYAVAVSSCSAGLHLAAIVAGLKKGKTILTSPNTFCSTANSALHCGANVEFVDIEKDTGNISLEAIKQKLKKKKIHAIAPVHFGGLPIKMQNLKKIIKKKNIIVFEDAAHALGAKYEDGSMVGSCKFSDMTVFSFHPVKSITTGEGGVITTNNKVFYEKLKNLRSHGIEKDKKKFKKINKNKLWYYEMRDLGFHYRITDFQCALGLTQLNKLKRFISFRKNIAEKYDKMFSTFKNVEVLQKNLRSRSANHLYVIKIKFNKINLSREKIMQKLKKSGINTQVHYIPIIFHPFYQKKSLKGFDNIKNYYSECLSIPIFYNLKREKQKYIVNSIRKITEK